FLLRAQHIRIVETLDEAAAILHGKKPVEQSGSRIADVDVTRRRRGETNGYGHLCGLADGYGVGKAEKAASSLCMPQWFIAPQRGQAAYSGHLSRSESQTFRRAHGHRWWPGSNARQAPVR